MTIEVRGQARLLATLEDAGGQMRDMPTAQKLAADVVQRRARSEAPQLTGRLARSLRADHEKGRGIVTTTVPYGWPVHSGVPRHNIAPNPFMTRAIRACQPQVERIYLAELEGILATVKGD